MALLVEEVLTHPALGIRVLVEGQQDREVRWVHATEQADPTPYLRGGEIVLTDGLWLDCAQTSIDYVRRLRDIDIAAIGYGPMPGGFEVPTSLIQACRAEKVCLFVMPPTLPFMAVTEIFVERLAQDREVALASNVARNLRLLEVARSGGGTQGLLDVLCEEIARPVWICGTHGQVVCHAGRAPTDADRDALARSLRDGRLRGPTTIAGWHVQAIMSPDVPRGYLAVAAFDNSDDDRQPADVIDQALPFLGMELAHARALSQGQRRFTAEILDLVLGGEQSRAQVSAKLAATGINDGELLAVVVCVHPSVDPDETLDGVEAVLTQNGYRWLGAVKDGQVVVFAVWDRSAEELPDLGMLLHEVTGAEVGIGSLARAAAGLRTSVVEARHACRLTARRRNGLGHTSYAELGSFRVLLDLHTSDVLRAFSAAVLDPIRRHDEQHNAELIMTITRFLDLGGSWQATAADLHIHVNTLRNRLARIETLLDRSLAATSTRVDLYLALHAASIVDA